MIVSVTMESPVPSALTRMVVIKGRVEREESLASG